MPRVTVDGVGLHYTDTGGGGTPVVLLHAFPLHSGMWEPQIQALGDRYRMIAPDLKGFGDSDAPDTPTAYTMEAYALELSGLLQQAGVTNCILCGLSMGGYIALEFWRRYPDTVRALVLADTRAEPDAPEGRDKRTKQQQQVASGGLDGLIDTLAGALPSAATADKRPDVIDKMRALMRNPPAGFIGALEAMKKRPDSTADLAGITVPTLILVGENDAVTPPEASRSMQGAIKDATLVTIPEAGHISNLENPEAFTEALAGFLDGLHSEGQLRR